MKETSLSSMRTNKRLIGTPSNSKTIGADLSEATSPEETRVIIDEMLQVFYDDGPWLHLYFQPDFYAIGSVVARVEGLPGDGLGEVVAAGDLDLDFDGPASHVPRRLLGGRKPPGGFPGARRRGRCQR